MQKPLLMKLVNLLLLVLLFSLAVAAVVVLFQKSYFPALVLFLAAGFLFWARSWSDYSKISLLLLCLFFYLAAYLTNVVLILQEPKVDQSFQERLDAARRLGVPYDTRTPLELVADYQARGIDAVPVLSPFDLVLTGKSLPAPTRPLLPLGGISQKTTVHCNECGDYAIYQADERGFNNPRGVWSRHPLDILIIGDSFTHGACVPPADNLGSLLRQGGRTVLNLGYAGNGPLLELAGLREYGPALKPKVVLWLYFEGNDLTDLAKEKESAFLTPYLQDGSYSQDLIHRQAIIDQGWSQHLEASQEHVREERRPWYYRHRTFLEFLRTFQLKKLKQTIRKVDASLNEYLYQEQVHYFKQVLLNAIKLVHSWGGTLYFVYLPSFYRYAGKDKVYPLNQRDRIIETVQSLGIPLIDFHTILNRLPDPLGAFPFKTNGHYTKAGYKMLARQIVTALHDHRPPAAAYSLGPGGRP